MCVCITNLEYFFIVATVVKIKNNTELIKILKRLSDQDFTNCIFTIDAYIQSIFLRSVGRRLFVCKNDDDL